MSELVASIDYDKLMQANLERVFGERNPAQRIEAIRELYTENAQLHEPGGVGRGP